MHTKQRQDSDVLVQIGPVVFRTETIDAKLQRARERAKVDKLLEFLNINPLVEENILEYARKAQYIFQYLPDDCMTNFTREFDEIRSIVQHVISGEVTHEELKKIGKNIAGVSIRIHMKNGDELERLNDQLYKIEDKQYESVLPEDKKKLYFIEMPELSSVREMIWFDLYKLIKYRFPIKQCAEMRRCRRFFTPDPHTPGQKYCSLQCRDRNAHRRAYELANKKL